MLIAFEGIDGSGKSTTSEALRAALARTRAVAPVVHWTSFQMYANEHEELLFGHVNRLRMSGDLGPLAYAAWHAADFAYRLETFVQPALARGEVVIMDRYKYTGIVRDVIRGLDEGVVRSLYAFAPDPDLLIYLDIDPAVAYRRKKERGLAIGFYESARDLYGHMPEEEGFVAFQGLCRRRYEQVLPQARLLKLDGSRPAATLNAEILASVEAVVA